MTTSQRQFKSFDQIKKVHIIGVCGTLMGSFAAYLKRRGLMVTGSDQNVYPPMSDVLMNAGVELISGYRAENLTALAPADRPDLVVIGNVITAANPEARAAIDGGFAYSSLPEAMENLLLTDTRNLVVAGTHGKTTTSSMLAHVLVNCKRDPSYFIGGVSQDLPFSFNLGGMKPGSPFVLEGDEYDTAFWDKVPKFNHYLPDDVILTSVEYDHADIYPDFAAVVRAFEGLMHRIRPQGRLIACADYAVVVELAKLAEAAHSPKIPVIFYGSQGNAHARFMPGKITTVDGLTHFEIQERQGGAVKTIAQGTIQVPGHHNVMNALAVYIEARELGLGSDEILRALASFRGVKRRQEVRGEVEGVLVLDDFAHHPTAVRETLRALRMKYPERRLVTVFEPRSATSRRKVFQQEYVQAFLEADSIFIAAPYDQSKIASDDQFSSDQLVADLHRAKKSAEVMPTVEEGVLAVSKSCRPGDLVAVLSNGGFGGFIPKLLDSLKAR